MEIRHPMWHARSFALRGGPIAVLSRLTVRRRVSPSRRQRPASSKHRTKADSREDLQSLCPGFPGLGVSRFPNLERVSYGNATAIAARTTGNDQAQSPSKEMATAATTQPARKPKSRCEDLFNRSASTGSKGLREDASISDRTVLVKLPVITAVEIAPGMARRSRAYWHAIAETAIMTAMPAISPCGLPEGLVMTQKIKTVVSSTS